MKSYRDILKDVYDIRKKRNPSYSIVSFSRDAGFKSYHMSDILKGRYGLSPVRAANVAEALKLDPNTREEFLTLVGLESSKSPHDKSIAEQKIAELQYSSDKYISEESFSTISKWYYLAITEFFRNPKNIHASADEISEKLRIDLKEVSEVLQILKSEGLITYDENGYKVSGDHLKVKCIPPSKVIREFHKNMIQKSLESMEQEPVDKRFFTSFNVNLSPKEYEILNIELTAFIRKKINSMQINPQEDARLYAINLQNFPLEKESK